MTLKNLPNEALSGEDVKYWHAAINNTGKAKNRSR